MVGIITFVAVITSRQEDMIILQQAALNNE